MERVRIVLTQSNSKSFVIVPTSFPSGINGDEDDATSFLTCGLPLRTL
jgi:hypothetical protein